MAVEILLCVREREKENDKDQIQILIIFDIKWLQTKETQAERKLFKDIELKASTTLQEKMKNAECLSQYYPPLFVQLPFYLCAVTQHTVGRIQY